VTQHLHIVGLRRADRLDTAEALAADPVIVRCHRRLRGPYTGVDEMLSVVLADAIHRAPDLVERHRVELLYGIPELVDVIGPGPRTLASESPFKQRTRFFGADMVRCMNHGIVTFLVAYARRVRDAGGTVATLVFDEVHAADPTTQELVAILLRRADPTLLRVVAGSAPAELPGELAAVLTARAERVEVEPVERPIVPRPADQLVAAFVQSDGTSDDPAEQAAYERADPAWRARLHDERAAALEPLAGWGLRVGAIAYHREHGSDPAGAGREALLAALVHCVQIGFSAAVVELGQRGRAVTDPVRDQPDFCEFTNQAAAAMVPLRRVDESLQLYLDLRQRYTVPTVHMTSSYAIAMLYTRFFQPRDHDTALQWQNNARAIASILPDPTDRLVYGVFQDNALALIEMHRGNLERALGLINAGIARLDEALRPDEWVLHRSQLLYNRARLLTALGRLDDAVADFTTLVEHDPYYTDYLSERAKISRRRGDYAAALADYDRAVELAPPFPELYYNRGTARADVGDVDGALADFGYVLEMEPDDVDTVLARAELLVRLGRVDEADADVATALSMRPDDVGLLCMRGTIEVERGRWAEAVAAFDAVLAADPRYPAALVNRAVAHHELGQHAGAVADLTAALALVGDDPDLLLNRGIAHLAGGDRAAARADFDRALALPDADTDELLRQRERCADEAGVTLSAAIR
jgi:tetratricopeptide (TPR) repeat protein